MGTYQNRVRAWFEERVGLSFFVAQIRAKTVPLHRYSAIYLLGGVTLFLFAVQVATGGLLMLYYRPTAQEAHESVRYLMTEVHYGWLVRSVHAWSSHLLIFSAVLHMTTVFFTKAYRRPRELTWISGCLLFFLVLGFGFSGYLLPWTELAFFATKVATEMARWMPVAGDFAARCLLGSDRIGSATLTRFYTLHVFVLPLLTLALVGIHVYLVQRHGMSVPPSVARTKTPPREVRFLPDFFYRDLLCWLLVLGIVLVLAGLNPAELGEKADPFAPAQQDIHPEWYFMFLFQTLRISPSGEIAGVSFEAILFLLLNVAGMSLLLVPFLDRGQGRETARAPRALTLAGTLVVSYVVVMTALGYRSTVPLLIAAGTLTALWIVFGFAGARGGGARG